MKNYQSKLLYFFLIAAFLYSCKEENFEPDFFRNEIIESFVFETGIGAVCLVDTSLLNEVKSWQGQGDYPGIDEWATAKIPNHIDLLGGLPGQSEFYTIEKTLIDSDTLKVQYWESLQVKENPTFGYRTMVGVFEFKDSLVVAIAKTLANSQYGSGGAWQIYVENYNEVLMVLDTVYLN